MKVALLHNPRPKAVTPGSPDDAFEEYDSPETIAAIAAALRGLGIEVDPITVDAHLPSILVAREYDFAFNIAEGAGRRTRETIAPALCELFGLPFTGSDALTLSVTLDKAIAKRIVSPEVKVARAALLLCERDEALLSEITYPAIVKPNDEGSSKGIRADGLVDNAEEAVVISRRLRSDYGCPVLVEEFLSGPEVTVGILGNGVAARILGMMEIAPRLPAKRFIYSIEVKRDWRRQVDYHVPPRLPATTLDALQNDALTAYHLLGCRDFGRIDFRLDRTGQPVFLECNALPGLDPENSDLILLSRDRLSYEHLVQAILLEACKRTGVALR